MDFSQSKISNSDTLHINDIADNQEQFLSLLARRFRHFLLNSLNTVECYRVSFLDIIVCYLIILLQMIKIVLGRLIKDQRLLDKIDDFLYNRKSREYIHSQMSRFTLYRWPRNKSCFDTNDVNNWKLLARDVKVAQLKNIYQYNGLKPPDILRFIL